MQLASSLQMRNLLSGAPHASVGCGPLRMNTTEVLNRFESLPFSLEVEVGVVELSVRDLLDLKPGMVLETKHPAGTPLTLLAGGTPVATAEVVLVEDALSVRVKELLSGATRTEQPAV
jgi:flagellar motor switch/type III secretory pathway protein FliN